MDMGRKSNPQGGMMGGGPGKDPSSRCRGEATGQEVIMVLLGDVGGSDGRR